MLKQEYSNFERRADSIEKITENLMEKLRDELVEDFIEQQVITTARHFIYLKPIF